jgi:hypothetical protein
MGKAKLIYCGQWSCERCAKRQARRWANRIRKHMALSTSNGGAAWFMLTLTLGGSEREVEPAYRKLKKLWNRLRMAINRQVSGKWQYAAFVEGQPKRKSMPHFHIIIDIIPKQMLNKKGKVTQHNVHNMAHKYGWGFEADFGVISDEKAAWYVSKYVSKGAAVIPRGFRRVRTSQHWTPFDRDPEKRLIVRRSGEALPDYLIRVQEFANVPLDDLHSEWATAVYELDAQQQA